VSTDTYSKGLIQQIPAEGIHLVDSVAD